MKIKDIITEEVTQRLDAKCWAGKHKAGTKVKGGVRVNNCVPNESVAEASGSISVKGWAAQVRNEHGSDVKFTNDKHGGGTVNRAIARNSQGETVGVYNRNTGAATVFDPNQNVDETAARIMKETVVSELFDPATSFPLRWDTQFAAHGEVHAHTEDSQGREIHISFVPTELRLTPDSKDATEVAFSRGGNYEVTGKGDAGKVLATVVNAIEIFLQKYRPDCVVFSAKEGSRASLYASMIKRIARGYKLLTPAEYPEDVHTYLNSVGSDAPFILARQ